MSVIIGHGTTVTLLDAVTSGATGESKRLVGKDRTFQVEGISGDTVIIEVSNDGSTFYTIITATADGAWESNAPWRFVRARVSSYSAGTITVLACV